MKYTHTFKPVQTNIHFPNLEEEILAYWKKNKIFERSVHERSESKEWTFLDGPPFITGLPHYGTLLSSIPKDIFPRFKTMQGYRVRRVWGWDCHGLPAENKVEATLKIKRKKDIEEKVGVKTFIDECKKYVSEVSGEWEWYVDHIARWVDFNNAYKTMDTPYMESVMWVFKTMYDKGYIYKGLRVSLYCPHCSTPISNFEVAMDPENYKMIHDTATTYKYPIVGQKDTYILAWSTTPWNKLATPALAVNPNLQYAKVKQGNEYYILAETTLKMLTDDPYEIVERFSGQKLLGIKFVPHYDFYKIEKGKKAFIIIPGDFVTAEEGTGVVTIAAYGEDDLKVMQRDNIQIVLHVDDEGILKHDVPTWAGMYYLDVNPLVNDDLRKRGLLYRDDPISHTVPTCWRCHTRLIYAPQDAWYVDIASLREKLYTTNNSVNWYPSHFKEGRFKKSMEAAPDWCISRSRYWGSPVPVWECECGERFIPGSIQELERRSGKKIHDLHKPEIDEITVQCATCGKHVSRVSEVLDSWIEAGSAWFGERHFPFEKGQQVSNFRPPDFIVEYTGQIRAWFYVLHVISTAIYESKAFKNVVVTGVILGTDGRKMSKNYGNYPDPKEMLQKYGGDALRLYLMSSPVMHAEDIRISEIDYRNQVRGFLLIYWNIYNFFIMNAMADGWKPENKSNKNNNVRSSHILDRWILSKLNGLIQEISDAFEGYDTPKAVERASEFLDSLSTWYIRRIRDRVGPSATNKEDKMFAYQTLYQTLLTFSKLVAPLIPFISEEIYRNLTGLESVHLTEWPIRDKQYIDETLEANMEKARSLASLIHAKRKEAGVKVRIPIQSLSYSGNIKFDVELLSVLLEETNVQELTYTGKSDQLSISGSFDTDNQDLILGEVRELIRMVQSKRKVQGCGIGDTVIVTVPVSYKKTVEPHLALLKQKTLASEVLWGEELSIST